MRSLLAQLRAENPDFAAYSDQDLITAASAAFGGDVNRAAAYFGVPINEPGFGTALKSGLATYPVGIGRALEDAGMESVGGAMRRYGEDVQFRNPTSIHGFEDFARSPWQGAKEAAGMVIGSAAPAMIPYIGPIGRALGTAGTMAAGTGLAALPSYGGIRADQEREGTGDILKAIGGASAVGFVEQLGGLQRVFRPGRGVEQTISGFSKTPLRTFGRTAVRQGMEEGLEEAVQNPIEQWSAGQDPLSGENLGKTGFGAFQAAVGSIPTFGLLAGARAGLQHSGYRSDAAGMMDSSKPTGTQLEGMDLQRLLMNQENDPATAQQWYDTNRAELIQNWIADGMAQAAQAGDPVDLLAGGMYDTAHNAATAEMDAIAAASGSQPTLGLDARRKNARIAFSEQLPAPVWITKPQLQPVLGPNGTPIDYETVEVPFLARTKFDLWDYQQRQAGMPQMPGWLGKTPSQPMGGNDVLIGLPHQGQVMAPGTQVDSPVARAASIMQAAARSKNIIPSDVEWAQQTLKAALPEAQYNNFVASLTTAVEERAAHAAQRGVKKAPGEKPADPQFLKLYKESGGLPAQPVSKVLAEVRTPEDAIKVVQAWLEKPNLAQKTIQALETMHKKLTGETYVKAKQAKEAKEAGAVPTTQQQREAPGAVRSLTPAEIAAQYNNQGAANETGRSQGTQAIGQQASTGTPRAEGIVQGAPQGERSANAPQQTLLAPGEKVVKRKRKVDIKGATNGVRASVQPGVSQDAQVAGNSQAKADQGVNQAAVGTQDQGTQDTEAEVEDIQSISDPYQRMEWVLREVAKRDPRKARAVQLYHGLLGSQPHTSAEIAERLGVGKDYAGQLAREGTGIMEGVIRRNRIDPESLIPKEDTDSSAPGETVDDLELDGHSTYEQVGERGEIQQAEDIPLVSSADESTEAALANSQQAEGGDKNLGMSVRTVYDDNGRFQMNSSNVEERPVRVGTRVGGAVVYEGEEKVANKRVRGLVKARAAEDTNDEASLVWDTIAQRSSTEGEAIKGWAELGETERGRQTQETWAAFYAKSLAEDPKKVASMQFREWRNIVKATYYAWGRQPTPANKDTTSLDGSSVSRALDVLQDAGLSFLLDHVAKIVVVEKHPTNSKWQAHVDYLGNGQYSLAVRIDVISNATNHNIGTVLHEFGHIYDKEYSGSSLTPGFTRYANMMRDLWTKKDPVWADYFAYPFGPRATAKLREFVQAQLGDADLDIHHALAVHSEAYAQGFAAYLTPNSEPLPKPLARFFEQEIKNGKSKGRQDAADSSRGLERGTSGSAGTEGPAETKGRQSRFIVEPAKAAQQTAKSVAKWVANDPRSGINPKVGEAVSALNAAGIVTDMSGDMYGNDMVYVDLFIPTKALAHVNLPKGWIVTDRLVPVTFEDLGLLSDWHVEPGFLLNDKNEKTPVDDYRGTFSDTITRIARRGGYVSRGEAAHLAKSIVKGLNELPDEVAVRLLAGMQGTAGVARGAIGGESPTLSTDNPGGTWERNQQKRVEEAGLNEFGAPRIFGESTGSFSGPVLIPLRKLQYVPGREGEQRNVRTEDLEWLKSYMSKHERLPPVGEDGHEYPPFIQVDYKGRPWVNEGNHRIMAALALGWEYLPVQVQYHAGGERAEGTWKPDKLLARDKELRGTARLKEPVRHQSVDYGGRIPQKVTEAQDRTMSTVKDLLAKYLPTAMTLHQLADVFGTKLTALRDYAAAMDRMEQTQQAIMQTGHDAVMKWQALHGATAQSLSRLMRRATMKGVHPDLPMDHDLNRHFTDQAEYDSLANMYQGLPAEARDVYQQVKNVLAENWKRRKAAYAKAVTNAYAKHIDELVAAGKQGDADRMKKERDAAIDKHNKQVDSLRGPYFPLLRFGDHLVIAKSRDFQSVEAALRTAVGDEAKTLTRKLESMKKQEQHYAVEAYEDRYKADQAAVKYSARGMGVTSKLAEDHLRPLAPVNSGAIERIGDRLSASFDSNTAAKAKQIIVQMYLQSMPEHAALNRELKRVGVEGATWDMMRAVAKGIEKDSFFLARLEYADEVADKLYDLKGQAQEHGKDFEYIYRDLSRRTALDLEYKDTPIQNFVAKMSSIWHLGMSPAYLLTNMSQPWMITAPVLGGKFGLGRSFSALRAAWVDAAKIIQQSKQGGAFADIDFKAVANAGEREMLEYIKSRGQIDITQNLDMGLIADGASPKTLKAHKAFNWANHHIEASNRVVTALAAYRLARGKGMDQEQATQYAFKMVTDTQLNYTNANAAYWMKNGAVPLGKLVFQFRKYQQGMLYLLARNAQLAFKGDKDAQRALAYLMFMQLAMAGAAGVPVVTAPIAAVGLFVGGGDDEKGKLETQIRNHLADILGPEAARALWKGLPTLLGLDVSQRLGMGDVYNPLPYLRLYGRTGEQKMGQVLTSVLGAPFGMFGRMYDSGGFFASGDWVKGTEKLLPKMFADVVKAGRYSDQGITTRKGETAVKPDKIDGWDIAIRAAGFSPVVESEHYAAKQAVEDVKSVISEKRDNLIAKYAQAKLRGESTTGEDAAIEEFNKQHPGKGMRIDYSTKVKAVQARKKVGSERSPSGVQFRKNERSLEGLDRFAY